MNGATCIGARNHILAGLSTADAERVDRYLKPVELWQHAVVHYVDEPHARMYFVESGMISLVSATGGGTAVETAVVGPEGASGIPLFHEVPTAYDRGVVQIPGRGYTIDRAALAALLAECPT